MFSHWAGLRTGGTLSAPCLCPLPNASSIQLFLRTVTPLYSIRLFRLVVEYPLIPQLPLWKMKQPMTILVRSWKSERSEVPEDVMQNFLVKVLVVKMSALSDPSHELIKLRARQAVIHLTAPICCFFQPCSSFEKRINWTRLNCHAAPSCTFGSKTNLESRVDSMMRDPKISYGLLVPAS